MSALAQKMPAFFRINDEKEAGRFWNWILLWLILPNISFMILWFIGAPPRYREILVIGFIGLIAKRFPFWLKYCIYVACLGMSALLFVSGLFNLNISSLIYSLKFFAEIKPANSIEYIIVGCIVIMMLVVGFFQARKDCNFTKPWLIILSFLMFMGMSTIDFNIGKGMRGHYKRAAPEGAYFTSAQSQSPLLARADGKRHVVIIMMESMGVPHNNPEASKLLFSGYKNSTAVKERYELSQGTTLYYNSTTAGEVRELCGRWGDYYDLLDTQDKGCLPAQLAAKGYKTHAMHSFIGSFFERDKWYPNIGFQKQEFYPELYKNGAEDCGGVFAGVCDRDVPKQMGKVLKEAKQPTFLYWLTVNSHLPVPSGLNLNTEQCERISPYLAKEFPQICRQFAIWHDIDTEMVKQITDDSFPETDILIVGDHMPPFFDRTHRSQFNPERTPWLYLRHKGTQ